MKYILTKDDNVLGNELQLRMKDKIEVTRNRILDNAVTQFHAELEKIMAEMSIKVATYYDDYDNTRRLKIELVTPEED